MRWTKAEQGEWSGLVEWGGLGVFVSPLRGCGVKSDDTTCGGCSYAHLSSSILHGLWKGILLSVKGTIESYTQPQENVSAKKSMMYCTDFTDSVVTLVTAIL